MNVYYTIYQGKVRTWPASPSSWQTATLDQSYQASDFVGAIIDSGNTPIYIPPEAVDGFQP